MLRLYILVPIGSYTLEQYARVVACALTGGKMLKMRRAVDDSRIEEHDGMPVLVSSMKPWNDVVVETYPLPPVQESENWHPRIHRITTGKDLKTAEDAFAVYGCHESDGRALTAFDEHKVEGWILHERKVGIPDADANSNHVESRTVLPANPSIKE